ncbi:hypothetical protein Kpol_1018p136 [Vanderwaltozyma polyspora DSM 70294]|uniref:Cwf19-like C-terminal domain-containing protein n=1 Tax=Vanderwaltozyma polyspora (strain ATCC 22028 / DSM 70294 / BCRC 21397 / CBS 2163 / NBRC 10782 / NRRL Y-8283 / UCD 57-17) TaxID=436907 RepID=A7TDX8_VANPO|nr:uncharacterized protein Kpol_1018p136 [Vanderwaltozyma polyspora DSM 70294]EDO19598.1 hypothetical protein Kpol_1018p136 [Vanderwaltozyma polyspora DSM 70294]
MEKSKVLITSIPVGSYKDVEEKLKKLNKKPGPFDAILVLGEKDLDVQDIDTIELSPLYFFASNDKTDLNSKESSGDVTFLNNYGMYQLSNGLKITYLMLTGKELIEQKASIVKYFSTIDKPVDIFISFEWSVAIAKNKGRILGNEVVDDVVKLLQPKYHFSNGDKSSYLEYNPFKWDNTDVITRFLNIAEYKSKEKWAYAVNIDLNLSQFDQEIPENLIQNPFTAENTKENKGENSNVVEYSKRFNDDELITERKIKKQKTVLPTNCHFCFTNPNVEDHMFISIGNHSYLTIAKGPLSVPKGEMDFSGHCLIVPIEHIPKLNNGQDSDTIKNLNEEITRYEKSVADMNYTKYDMSTVTFEIHSSKSVHYHEQILPVPKYLIMKFQTALDRQVYLNNEKFQNNAKLSFQEYKQTDNEYLEIIDNVESNFFRFKIYETNEAEPRIFIAMFKSEERIDLQFGRRVLSFLLKLPKRMKWDSLICQQTKDQEIQEVKKFQKGYKSFDIVN